MIVEVAGVPDWWASPDKGCAGRDPELFFPVRRTERAYRAALAVCKPCPFRVSCAEYAQGIPWGVWGATTPEQRGFPDRRQAGEQPRVRRTVVPKGVAVNRPVVDRAVLFAAAGAVLAGEETSAAACARLGAGATLLRSAVRVCRDAPHLVEAVVAGRVTLYAAELTARLS